MKYERLTNSKTAKSMRDNRNTSNPYYVRLAEIEDKIENETLVELPCKVGDTLYRFYATERVIPVKVERITIASTAILVETTYGNFLLQEVGRDIFLTKAEAEKQLEELRKQFEEFYQRTNSFWAKVIRRLQRMAKGDFS